MIRRLRDRHRRIVLLVALATALVAAWSLAEWPSRQAAERSGQRP